jgi:hypothetical protein
MYASANMSEAFKEHVCVIRDREEAKNDPSSNVRVQLRALVDDGELTASEFSRAIRGLNRWMNDMPEGSNPDLHAQLYQREVLRDEEVGNG